MVLQKQVSEYLKDDCKFTIEIRKGVTDCINGDKTLTQLQRETQNRWEDLKRKQDSLIETLQNEAI